MKTTVIFFSLLLVSSTIIFPQLKAGSFLVGGGLTGKIESFDNSSNRYYDIDKGDIVEFTFLPDAGYFILENIAIGLTARIGLTDYKSEHFYEEEITSKTSDFYFTYGVGPFFRYYTPLSDFAFFFGFKYEWLWEEGEQEYKYIVNSERVTISENNRTRNIISPALGISYFFNQYVSIESMLRYEIETRKLSYSYKGSNGSLEEYDLETNFNRFLIVVGLQIYFPVE